MENLPVTDNKKHCDIDSDENIQIMVDSFYRNVRNDEILGPIFEEVVSDWDKHLPTMYQFWGRLILGTSDYNGNPFEKHVDLPVGKEHFARWIKLFFQNIDENFSGPKAEQTKMQARTIADTFQLRLGINLDGLEYAVHNYTRP
jgi:hemoglobin